jgi:hypothetical protein
MSDVKGDVDHSSSRSCIGLLSSFVVSTLANAVAFSIEVLSFSPSPLALCSPNKTIVYPLVPVVHVIVKELSDGATIGVLPQVTDASWSWPSLLASLLPGRRRNGLDQHPSG